MNKKELGEYRREYNKDTYKTIKVYIREEEYPDILQHMKLQGYSKISGYIKDLIAKDMSQKSEEQKNIKVQNSHGFIIGDNNGTINM